MKTYTAVCERVGRWWEITVPELDGRLTQARRLDQVEEMVRSLVSLIVDIPADSFEVAIQPNLPSSASDEVRQAIELRSEADRTAEAASKATRKAARQLAGMGLTVRDIGATLQLTPQRVSQLLGGSSGGIRTRGAAASTRTKSNSAKTGALSGVSGRGVKGSAPASGRSVKVSRRGAAATRRSSTNVTAKRSEQTKG